MNDTTNEFPVIIHTAPIQEIPNNPWWKHRHSKIWLTQRTPKLGESRLTMEWDGKNTRLMSIKAIHCKIPAIWRMNDLIDRLTYIKALSGLHKTLEPDKAEDLNDEGLYLLGRG